MKKTVLSSTLLLILLTGCGGNPATDAEPAGPTPNPAETSAPASAPSDAPSVEGLTDAASGTFSFRIDQAQGDVVLPAEAPEDVEGLRAQLGQDPVSYVLVTVQNPDGGVPIDLDTVTVSTPEGQDLQFRPASTVIEEWGAAANNGGSSPEVTDLVGQYSGGAIPGETSELLMIGAFPEVPDTVRTVMVQPAGGGEPVEATANPES